MKGISVPMTAIIIALIALIILLVVLSMNTGFGTKIDALVSRLVGMLSIRT
jgi:hypothetical protein